MGTNVPRAFRRSARFLKMAMEEKPVCVVAVVAASEGLSVLRWPGDDEDKVWSDMILAFKGKGKGLQGPKASERLILLLQVSSKATRWTEKPKRYDSTLAGS